MSDVEKYASEIKELYKCAEDFKNKVNRAMGGSFSWGVEQVIDSYLSMFDRFCPYKIGDRVQLKSTCKIPDSSGWYTSRHFLTKGSKAIVRDRGYSDGQFSFFLEFDDESWIDEKGNVRPVISKHVFGFGEHSIEPMRED
jgi:hypothetical protein